MRAHINTNANSKSELDWKEEVYLLVALQVPWKSRIATHKETTMADSDTHRLRRFVPCLYLALRLC